MPIIYLLLWFSLLLPCSAWAEEVAGEAAIMTSSALANVTAQEQALIDAVIAKGKLDPSIRSADALVQSAQDGNNKEMTILASLLEEQEQFDKARYWYTEAAKAGNVFAIKRWSNLLISGKGGELDVVKPIRRLRGLADKNNQILGGAFVVSLQLLDWDYGFDTDTTVLSWYEDLANRDINVLSSVKGNTGPLQQVEWIGNYYENKAKHAENRRQLLERARHYYKRANALEALKKINRVIDQEVQEHYRAQSLLTPALCRNLFSNADEALKLHERYQQDVFASPNHARRIVKSYRAALEKRYLTAGESNVSINFESASLRNIMYIYFLTKHDINIESANLISEDAEVAKASFKIVAKGFPVRYALALILATNDIDVDCSNDKVHFSSSGDAKIPDRLITPHLISSWDKGLVVEDNQLQGNGKVVFESLFQYQGEVVRSLPNGKGAYLDADGIATQQNERFIDGVAAGQGINYVDGQPYCRGNCLENESKGNAELAFERFKYVGDVVDMRPSGVGRLEYVKRPFDNRLQKYYPIDDDAEVISFFEGAFVDGVKAGKGRCGIKENGSEFYEFDCEFYRGNLVSVGGVYILPSHYAKATHNDLYL